MEAIRMNALELFGAVFLGGWFLAMLSYGLRVPWVHVSLKRVNWFRGYAHWNLFGANPDLTAIPGTYEIEVRNRQLSEAPADWEVIGSGLIRSPLSLLLNPAQLLAARVQSIGVEIQRIVDGETGELAEQKLRNLSSRITTFFYDVSGRKRGRYEFRVMKRYQPQDRGKDREVWRFKSTDSSPV